MRDPRLTPARPDLAAAELRGQVEAARFVEGRPARLAVAIAALRRRPEPAAPLETQVLFGEAVTIYDERDGWAWVQLQRDSYVGYLEGAFLTAPQTADPPRRRLAYACLSRFQHQAAAGPGDIVRGARDDCGPERRFPDRRGGAAFWARHLKPVESVEADFVGVAERFLHSPYLWGGRSSEGIDCSGLTQAALTAAGVAAPRDSDMLERIGRAVEAPPQRGDLVFWKGHVGVMQSAEMLLHANGYHMAVVSEPLAQARARIAASGGGEITSIRWL